jgi:glycosyltransferase involved in cell wall biosynthesis
MEENNKYRFTPLPEPIPITEQIWPEGTLPLVHTSTITYMHENYIRECIEGVLMQKTTFPVLVLIHDDASADKTADIVREYECKYPNLIKAYYQKENSYTKPDRKERRTEFNNWKTGKYEATCEGDDYWTEPLKLQKQVDFLEHNPEFSLCCHRYKIYNEESNEWKNDYGHLLFDEKISGIEIDNEHLFFKKWLTKTMTVMFRKSSLNLEKISSHKYSRDITYCYYLLKAGKGYCMNYDAAVYRVHKGGVWGLKNDIYKLKSNLYVIGELYRYNKEDKTLIKRYNYIKIKLFTGFITKNFPFFSYSKLKEYMNIYNDYSKGYFLLYPIFFMLYFIKRIFYHCCYR